MRLISSLTPTWTAFDEGGLGRKPEGDDTTVYEYFMDQKNFNEDAARKSQSRALCESLQADAAKWERRAKALTPTVASKSIDEVIVWRVLDEIKQRTGIE